MGNGRAFRSARPCTYQQRWHEGADTAHQLAERRRRAYRRGMGENLEVALPDRVADDYFDYLANWYAAQCDDEWEHEFGIRLQTLDNPGWNLQIDLVGTD